MSAIRTVGVVGAGTMGQGIAQVCAAAGFSTTLYDVNPEQVERALRGIEENLAVAEKKNKLSHEDRLATLSRLQTASTLEALKVDLIVEAAIERLDIKQELFKKLEAVNSDETIFATNTSSLSVTRITEKLGNPSRCIGLHFFNPAERMKLVEIISGSTTSPQVVAIIQEFTLRIGKSAVMAKDSPGFIVNRVARHYYVESLKLVEDKVAEIPAVDALLRSAGFRMGPFELMDLIGVDTNLAVTTSVYEGFDRAPKFAPSPIQQQLVREGRLGRKTGKGFYDYSAKTSG